MNIKDLKYFCLIGILSLITAFLVNYMSPVGIALIGEWDIKNGVISANSKNSTVNHKREITENKEVKKLFDLGVLFMDARTSKDYLKGHIKGAISIPVNKFEENVEMIWTKFKKDQRIITYCSGIYCEDSHMLAKNLEELGYKRVSVFPGGFPEWKKEGFPVEK